MVDITVRQIEAGDTVTGLSLGHEDFAPLKGYLRRDAKKHHEQSLARTYGVFLDDTPRAVKGYLTLVCGEVVSDPGNANGSGNGNGNGNGNGLVVEDGLHYPYRQYPAVKIARLAVDTRLKKLKLRIGTQLVDLAIGIAKDRICPAVGCRFIVVDAKKRSVGFYLKSGFTAIDTEENLARDEPIMFVDLHKLT